MFLISSLYQNRQKILEKSQLFFYKNSSSYTLKIGCELEFFLLDKNNHKILDKKNIQDFCYLSGCKPEQGEGQIEITTKFTQDLIFLAQNIESIKKNLSLLAHHNNFQISFDGKPFEDDCGSSLQFNISLHNHVGENIFRANDLMHQFCATGLLELTNEMLILLAPKSQDYLRFNLDLNKKLFTQKKYTAPVNLSFGNDNRTCAIRYCNTNSVDKAKRLEYRVASANCDIWLALSAVVLALSFGILNEKNNYTKIYGNAFDNIYNAPKILDNIDLAQKNFIKNDNFILTKMLEFLQ